MLIVFGKPQVIDRKLGNLEICEGPGLTWGFWKEVILLIQIL
jgi:hypothetical protein